MALYIPHSIFHLVRLLYVRQETFGTYYVRNHYQRVYIKYMFSLKLCKNMYLNEHVLCVYPLTMTAYILA